MITLPLVWFFFRALTRNPFPKTREAIKRAQKRAQAVRNARKVVGP